MFGLCECDRFEPPPKRLLGGVVGSYGALGGLLARYFARASGLGRPFAFKSGAMAQKDWSKHRRQNAVRQQFTPLPEFLDDGWLVGCG